MSTLVRSFHLFSTQPVGQFTLEVQVRATAAGHEAYYVQAVDLWPLPEADAGEFDPASFAAEDAVVAQLTAQGHTAYTNRR